VIDGFAEGRIVCRRLPDFMSGVLDAKERIRFHSTIQKQVEGELIMHLRGRGRIKESRQQTRVIKDDILLEAAKARINVSDLHQLFNMAKTISYNETTRTIHFFFFDRATAVKYQRMQIPFNGVIHGLRNAHQPDSGPVWARQLGRDGVRLAAQREYAIDIYNVTRFTDVGRLLAYLQKHVKVEFDLEDRGIGTPNSRTSTVWRMTMKSAKCPEFLRGIVRLMWFGRALILKHPYARQGRQCFKCGTQGHVMAQCNFTGEQLKGSGSRVAEEQEVAELEDLARPFANLAEVKASAAQRLKVQEAEERKEQAALQPSSRMTDVKPTETQQEGIKPEGGPAPVAAVGQTAAETPPVHPRNKRQYVAVPMSKGRTLYGHQEALQQRGLKVSTRYDVLGEDDSEDDAGDEAESKSEERPPPSSTIDLSRETDQEAPAKPKITPKEKARLHLVTAKPPKIQPTPQLLAWKQRERQAIEKAMQVVATQKGPPIACVDRALAYVTNFAEIETVLGIREVATPASGNCMAMAIAQALADHNLAAYDITLAEMTAAIKRGICWTGLMHCSDQFNHYTRMATLINMERGWDGMDVQESSKQFRWYLHEYAATSSLREVGVPKYNWGCSEFMTIAANFLQRNIYVLAYDTDGKQLWYCSWYRPSTMSRGKKVYETGQQVSLQLVDYLAAIRKEKQHTRKKPPLVLRFWGKHYSAFVHTSSLATFSTDSEIQLGRNADVTSTGEQGNEDELMLDAVEENQEESQDPWDPSSWDGDIDDLRRRLTGMTIPHELKCEIQVILQSAEPTRYDELLAFLVNTATQLSQPDRDQLLQMNLDGENTADMDAMLQRFQISKAVLKQWHHAAMQVQQDEARTEQDLFEPAAADSDSSWRPSRDSSQDVPQATVKNTWSKAKTPKAPPKRNHSVTPLEGEALCREQRTKLKIQTTLDAALQMTAVTQHKTESASQPGREDWPELWKGLQQVWPSNAKVPFPVETNTGE